MLKATVEQRARAAYAAYADDLDLLRTWKDLTVYEQQAWIARARRVV